MEYVKLLNICIKLNNKQIQELYTYLNFIKMFTLTLIMLIGTFPCGRAAEI